MEPMNFFGQLAALNLKGDLQITVRKGEGEQLVVSVLLDNDGCTDPAKRLLPPYNLRGTAGELDNGFFGQITAPMQAASGLQSDMESYMRQVEAAKGKSAAAKEKAEKERKGREAKEKQYRELMAKVDALEKEGRYRETWVKVPEPSDYPGQAAAIRKRKAALSAMFSPDLWSGMSAGDSGKAGDKAGRKMFHRGPVRIIMMMMMMMMCQRMLICQRMTLKPIKSY